MRGSNLRHGVMLLFVTGLLLSGLGLTAHAQELTPEQTAMNELAGLANLQPAPQSRADAVKRYAEVLPKIEAFAEKHTKDAAGAKALLMIAQISLQFTGSNDKVIAASTKYLERFPKNPEVDFAKYFLGSGHFNRREYAKAKKALDTLLKDHPKTRLEGQAKQMLSKIARHTEPFPDFKTNDLNGKEVKLSDFKGKIVLLDFYAGWCPPCRVEMPNLVKLYAKYKERGFEIIGISLDGSLKEAKNYVQQAGMTWTATWKAPGGWKTPLAQKFGISGIPATFLIGRDGKLIQEDLRGRVLEQKLEKLFADEAKAKAEAEAKVKAKAEAKEKAE